MCATIARADCQTCKRRLRWVARFVPGPYGVWCAGFWSDALIRALTRRGDDHGRAHQSEFRESCQMRPAAFTLALLLLLLAFAPSAPLAAACT